MGWHSSIRLSSLRFRVGGNRSRTVSSFQHILWKAAWNRGHDRGRTPRQALARQARKQRGFNFSGPSTFLRRSRVVTSNFSAPASLSIGSPKHLANQRCWWDPRRLTTWRSYGFVRSLKLHGQQSIDRKSSTSGYSPFSRSNWSLR